MVFRVSTGKPLETQKKARNVVGINTATANTLLRTATSTITLPVLSSPFFPLSVLSLNTTLLSFQLILFMNLNDSGERESGTGDHKKRKMIWDQDLPLKLRKRIKVGRIVILTWSSFNRLSYRKLSQVRAYPRPIWRPLRGRNLKAALVP